MNKLCIVSILVLSVAFVWVFVEKSREINLVNKRCDSLRHDLANAENMCRQLNVDKVRMQGELTIARSALKSKAPAEDVPYEDALDIWITKVKRLNGYLLAHPERRIPQMAKLSVEEWLDVTKDLNFDTEADYRKALGRLRGIARQKYAPDIGEAIRKFVAANNGIAVQDTTTLAQYLPNGYDLSIVNGFAYNPGGKIGGFRTENSYVYVEQPVDIWDSTLFYSADGKWGIRSATAPGEERMKSAVMKYMNEYGTMPSSVSQIMTYGDIGKIPEKIREELFRAITTRTK